MANVKEVVDQVVKDTRDALLDEARSSVPEVKEAAEAYLSRLPIRLTDNLNYMLGNPTDIQFLKDRFKDEEKILENEALSFAIIGKAIAQDVINKIQGILIRAVFSVLPAAL